MKSSKFAVLAAVSAFLLVLVGCSKSLPTGGAASAKEGVTAQAKPVASSSSSGIAGTVNGDPISEGSVKLILEQRGYQDTPDMRKKIVEDLAVQRLAVQKALAEGLDKQPDMITRLELSKQAILATAYVQDWMKKNPISEQRLQTEYDRIKAQSHGIEFKARDIVVASEPEAKAIVVALKKDPKSFPILARKSSIDELTKNNDGEMGWFEPSGKEPELESAVAHLAKGKFTEKPIHGQTGWHVVLLEDSRPKAAPPMIQMRAQLRHQAEQEDLRKMLDDMKAAAKIEVAGSVPK